MVEHAIFHQFDPTRHVGGGIPGYIVDLIRYAPPGHEFAIVGVDATGHKPVGRWAATRIGDRTIRFMPVARLDPGNQDRAVPHSARFVAGVALHRPRLRQPLVHTHRAEVGAAVTLLMPGHRRVQFIHGDGREALQHRSETFWRWLPYGYERLEMLAVQHAARTIVMSRPATLRLQRHSRNVAFGSNWFDDAIFSPGQLEDGGAALRIGWVGRLEPPKDPLRAIAVFQALAARGVEFSAWLAGVGTLEARVRRAIGESRLGDRVSLVGLLSPSALADELRRSTACLMTSRWEGVPRSAIEALACGVPVVSTDVGELNELVGSGVSGFIAGSDDPRELAARLLDTMSLVHGVRVAETVNHLRATLVVPRLLAELRILTTQPRHDDRA